MKNNFPAKNQNYTYLQTNRGDLLGSIWSSFNNDYQTNPGALRLSQKLVINTSSSDDADLARPSAFEFFAAKWWAICGTKIFVTTNDSLTSSFVEDTSTGAVSTYDSNVSDLAVFDNNLWSTADTVLYSSDGTTWTSRDTGLSSGDLHKLVYFKKFNRLYYSYDTDIIRSIDETDTVASSGDYFLDLDNPPYRISAMVANSSYVWIGTTIPANSSTGKSTQAAILAWDGISAQASNEYLIEAAGVLTMYVLNDIPYAVDSNARVLKFTGYSFEEVARLPVDRALLVGATSTATGNSSGKFIHFNGMQGTKNNTLLLGINNLVTDVDATIYENLPSGIWEVDLESGSCTHRYSFTLKTRASSTVTDYGQNRISGVGAIKSVYNATSTTDTDIGNGISTLLAGASVFTTATVILSGIFIDSPSRPTTDTEGQKKGYAVATWFQSREIADSWDDIWTAYRQFQNITDNVAFKYRIIQENPIQATITWTSTTTFTTTTNVSAYGPTATGFDGTTGGEVEVIQGTGSGSCTHIVSVSEAGGTYTVTLDEAVTGVSGTAKARFQKWIKIFPKEVQSTISSWSQYTIGTNSTPRIQVKMCLTWTGDGEFYKYIMNSNEDIKS